MLAEQASKRLVLSPGTCGPHPSRSRTGTVCIVHSTRPGLSCDSQRGGTPQLFLEVTCVLTLVVVPHADETANFVKGKDRNTTELAIIGGWNARREGQDKGVAWVWIVWGGKCWRGGGFQDCHLGQRCPEIGGGGHSLHANNKTGLIRVDDRRAVRRRLAGQWRRLGKRPILPGDATVPWTRPRQKRRESRGRRIENTESNRIQCGGTNKSHAIAVSQPHPRRPFCSWDVSSRAR
ncbi:hypothetical protein GGS23DRAFT_158160 [Durotheca rogersii]|uniref:uncharacterized protein n=1 Tax=Durotheca rogersii TaxID=419775 RepID=UPI0022201897|nr:uncharacterized protein GGS23DRAFT_158160 [Durotheca rogersii]KAI5861213.1 hypothetical protein GGS23DRAFT_158160 [Durotheca rogersii]